MKSSYLYKAVSCYGGHIEHHLEIIQNTKSYKSLETVLYQELYPHQNTIDTDVIESIVKEHKNKHFCTIVTFDLNLHSFVAANELN